MRKLTLFILLTFMSSSVMASALTEKSKIDRMLNALVNFDVTFIRNGEEHDGAWAKAHLEEKLKAANNPDMTAQEFITTIASTSSHTGKPYLIKTKDGETVEAAKWFQEVIDRMPVR
jgi:hypothetical protein